MPATSKQITLAAAMPMNRCKNSQWNPLSRDDIPEIERKPIALSIMKSKTRTAPTITIGEKARPTF